MKKIALLALAATFMFACQPEKKETTEGTVDSTAVVVEEKITETVVEETPQETVYQVRGQVVKIDAADSEGNALVTVNHEEIPEVMGAMQMSFKSNAAYLTEIKKDDKISFQLLKTEEGYTMRSVEKLPAETELTLKK